MTTGNKQQRGNIEVRLDLLPGAVKDSGCCWRTTVKTAHQQGQGLYVMGRHEAVSEAKPPLQNSHTDFAQKPKNKERLEADLNFERNRPVLQVTVASPVTRREREHCLLFLGLCSEVKHFDLVLCVPHVLNYNVLSKRRFHYSLLPACLQSQF
jgi:hypothetical protein